MALLEQLKSSTAWQELTSQAQAAAPETAPTTAAASSSLSSSPDYVPSLPPNYLPESSSGRPDNERNVASLSGSSVASLLSLLKPFSAGPVEPYSAPANFGYGYGEAQTSVTPRSSFVDPVPPVARLEPPEDRKNFTFRQSLPVISELSDNPSFTAAVKKARFFNIVLI